MGETLKSFRDLEKIKDRFSQTEKEPQDLGAAAFKKKTMEGEEDFKLKKEREEIEEIKK